MQTTGARWFFPVALESERQNGHIMKDPKSKSFTPLLADDDILRKPWWYISLGIVSFQSVAFYFFNYFTV